MSAVTFTNTDEERQARFQRALDLVITPAEREKHGIGMQMEKTLHAVLKAYEDPEEDHQEIPSILPIFTMKTGSQKFRRQALTA